MKRRTKIMTDNVPSSGELPLWSLPSETDIRFRMLIIAIIVLALHVGILVTAVLGAMNPTLRGQLQSIANINALTMQGKYLPDLPDAELLNHAHVRLLLQMQALQTIWPAFVVPVALAALLWGCAFAVYRRHPHRILAGRNTKPIHEEDA